MSLLTRRIRLALLSGILAAGSIAFAIEGQTASTIQERTIRLVSNIKKTNDNRIISQELEGYFKDIDHLVASENNKLKNMPLLMDKIDGSLFSKYRVNLSKSNDADIITLSKYLDENGMAMGFSEGDLYLFFNYQYLYRHLKGVVPNSINEYFLIESDFQKEEISEDGALIIHWDKLRLRIIRLEEYLAKISKLNCGYIERDAERTLTSYIRIYFSGLENDTDICRMIDEARMSYKLFLKENRRSRYYPVVKAFYADLKRNNFKCLSETIPMSTTWNINREHMMIYDSNNQLVDVGQVIDKYLKEAAFDKASK